MKFSPSKAASFSIPAATVAAPIASVVVLSVNETPVESIKLLDSTKQKLKNVELGMEEVKPGKPVVSEQEIAPSSKPVVVTPPSPPSSGESGSSTVSSPSQSQPPSSSTVSGSGTGGESSDTGKTQSQKNTGDSSTTPKETTPTTPKEPTPTTPKEPAPTTPKETTPTTPKEKSAEPNPIFDAVVGWFENLGVSNLASSSFVQTLASNQTAQKIIEKAGDIKEVAGRVSQKANEVYGQLPTKEKVVDTTKEVGKRTTDKGVGFFNSLLGSISSVTESLKNKAISK